MSLSIGSESVAECRIQSISLVQLLGAYELNIGLWLDIRQARNEKGPAFVTSARVSLKSNDNVKKLGVARPDVPIRVEPPPRSATSMAPVLQLLLTSQQLSAIEDFRNDADLNFSIQLEGEAYTSYEQHTPLQQELSFHMPRSRWIDTLRTAGATNNLLFEVPLPLGELTEEWGGISRSLHQAKQHFLQGDYCSVVTLCRKVCEAMGRKREWSNTEFYQLSKKDTREEMNKNQREEALWGAIKHYTHLANHDASVGGEDDFSRSEAQQILILTASMVARYHSR